MTTFRWLLLISGLLLAALVATLGYVFTNTTARTREAAPERKSKVKRVPVPSHVSGYDTRVHERRGATAVALSSDDNGASREISPEKKDAFLSLEGKARRADAAESFARTLIEDTKREPRDNGWASKAEADIHEAIAGVARNVAQGAIDVRSVQCGSIRCSLEAELTNVGATTKFVNQMTSISSLPRAHIRRSNAEDGRSMMRVIFARPGYLPTGVSEDSASTSGK